MSKTVFSLYKYKCTRWRLILITIIVLIILIEIHSIFFLMPSNYTLISHMENLRHTEVALYQVHGNAKFFKESEFDNHLDEAYYKGPVDKNETTDTLYFLFEQFFDWLQNNKTISSLKSAYISPDIMPQQYITQFHLSRKQGLIYFLDYGTLLGAYRNESIIPWDVNGDLGFMIKDLQQLPLVYDSEKWIFKQNPMFYFADDMTIYDGHNTVAGRVISKENGVFINIMPYSLISKQDLDMVYVYSTADFLEHEMWHKAQDLFPLNKNGTLKHRIYSHSMTRLYTPRHVKKWLLTYYSDLSVPLEQKDFDMYDNYDYKYNMYGGYGYDPEGHSGKIKDLKEQLEQQKEEIEKLKELVLSKKNTNGNERRKNKRNKYDDQSSDNEKRGNRKNKRKNKYDSKE